VVERLRLAIRSAQAARESWSRCFMRWKITAIDWDSRAFASAEARELLRWWNVGKMLASRSVVILSLQNPREKIWGVLLSVNTFGVTIRGIDINSFQDWSRSVANRTETMGLSTMFIPMMRVEKVILDETVGNCKSFSDQFSERVGRNVLEFVDLPEEEEFRFDA
jgi:hypothetical protein